jgi:hypothetical protein
MDFRKLTLFIDFIKEEDTGNANEFALKMGFKNRELHNYLLTLKSVFNAPIVFCKKRNSYVFLEQGHLQLIWKPQL